MSDSHGDSWTVGDESNDGCELSSHPIFLDGKVPCHACGWSVKALMVDGLWVYAPHLPDGTPLHAAAEGPDAAKAQVSDG